MVAVNSTVGVTQGNSITLEVYISGYPAVRSTNIHWYRLSPTRQEVTSGATFQDSGRRMILRNVQPSAAGTYECEATIPLFGNQILRGLARMQLQVYGEYGEWVWLSNCVLYSSQSLEWYYHLTNKRSVLFSFPNRNPVFN